MKVMEIEVKVNRTLLLRGIALSLDVDDYPSRCKEGKRISWIDCVLELLREEEEYDLTPWEKVIVLRHLGLDAEGPSYVRKLLRI